MMTQSFPPADAAIAFLQQIDYRKHYNSAMDAIESACLLVAAIAIIIGQQWQNHRCSDLLRSAAAIGTVAAAIIRETLWPAVATRVWPELQRWASGSAMLWRGILTPPLTV